MKPLADLLVIDFSQFLSGPSATLRLADLGARVIKIERPGGGDLCRQLYIPNLFLDGDTVLFHAINRNKESFAADLNHPSDHACVRELVRRADVIVQNFRPGVMEKLGFDYSSVQQFHPRVIYGEITGYGQTGPWRDKPGQDLLVQALSGLPWLNGDAGQPPVPFGLPVADLFAGAHLAQGILAALVRRGITGQGARVEISLLESCLDFQFEALTMHWNDGGKVPERSSINSAHAYLGAPYGIYRTADGYLALSLNSVSLLGSVLDLPELRPFADPDSPFEHRDQIKSILAVRLQTNTTCHWLTVFEPAHVWCANVLAWPELFAAEGFQSLNMDQTVSRGTGIDIRTTRCPIRLDGQILKSGRGAPRLGADTQRIIQEFGLSP